MGQDLKGQAAVITGGGSGIGRGLALALAGLGVKTVICGRCRERLEDTLAEIKAAGGEGLLVQADISEIKEARGVIQAALDAFSRIDILVNNAGIDGGEHTARDGTRDLGPGDEGQPERPFLLTRFALPGMRQQRYGQIINISSELGIEYYHADAAYGLPSTP